jgi:cathepsin L
MARTAAAVAVCVLVAIALVGLVSARPTWNQLDNYSFEQYVQDFHRTYADADEKHMRRGIFERTLQSVREHNAKNLSWKKGINQFSDRTAQEKRVPLGYRKDIGYLRKGDGRATLKTSLSAAEQTLLANLPTTVDWRKADIVSPVKDQGHCGSCWSFASASTLESFYALATGMLPTLSEQQILSCTPNPDECGGTGGCAGGTAELAFSTLLEHGSGIASEWCVSIDQSKPA